MIEVTNPWNRVPFYVGYNNQYYANSGYNNVGIINSAFTNLKADCPSSLGFMTGGSAIIYNQYTEYVTTWYSVTDYETVSIPRFEIKVTEGDYANAPWVGLAVTLEATLETDVTEYIGGTYTTTTTYSTLSYTYNLTASNYIPSSSDPNWSYPNQYVTPWGSTPAGPSYISQKYEDLGGGDYRLTYGFLITPWNYVSVVPGDFEVG